MTAHKRCIVTGCENHADEGPFVGDYCGPCHMFLSEGRGTHSQAWRNKQTIDAGGLVGAPKRCVGCGEVWGIGGCRHRLPCPYFDAWHAARTQADACGATKELGPEGKCKDYADAHWWEYWTPKIGDWVRFTEGSMLVWQIKTAEHGQFEGRCHDKKEQCGITCIGTKEHMRPAWPDEIAAAQAAAGTPKCKICGDLKTPGFYCPDCTYLGERREAAPVSGVINAQTECCPACGKPWSVLKPHLKGCTWAAAYDYYSGTHQEREKFANASWNDAVAAWGKFRPMPVARDLSQEHDTQGAEYASKLCDAAYYEGRSREMLVWAEKLRTEEQIAARARWWRFIDLLDQGR